MIGNREKLGQEVLYLEESPWTLGYVKGKCVGPTVCQICPICLHEFDATTAPLGNALPDIDAQAASWRLLGFPLAIKKSHFHAI